MTKKVEEVFKTLKTHNKAKQYNEYLKSIAPRSAQDVFWRFVFAYLSIHTTFKGNILGYLALQDPDAWLSQDTLCKTIQKSGAGMHQVRSKYLWEFRQKFFELTPTPLLYVNGYRELRNYLYENLNGIGIAKTSFSLEMSFPEQTEVVCFDVHQLRLYDQPEKVERSTYQALEDDWTQRSLEIGYTPFAARCHYWDILKEKPSPRFWSFIFEPYLYTFEEAQSLSFANNNETLNHVKYELQQQLLS